MCDSHNEPMGEFPAELKLYSTEQVAQILGISRKLVTSWIHQGELPAFRMGTESRIIRIRHQDLERFIQNHITPPASDGVEQSLQNGWRSCWKWSESSLFQGCDCVCAARQPC